MSYSYGKSIVTDGLVFYVDAANSKSYPGTGTTWTDLIGSNDGTLTNGPTYDSANGGSIVFDGVNDYIDCNSGVVNLNSSFTFSCWVKTPNSLSNNSNYSRVIGRGDVNTTYSGEWASISYDSNGDSFVVAIDDDTTKSEYFGSISLTTNTWYNVVMSVDRGNNIYLYVNTTLDGSVADNTSLNVDPPYNLYIGSMRNNNTIDYPLKGNISNCSVYNRSLTPQ